MPRNCLKLLVFLLATLRPQLGLATSSAELLTAKSYGYGRFEARARFAAGSGVVSSFFLWKDGSEQAGTFWNELDFEKLGAECRLETNPIYGSPAANHSQRHELVLDLCGSFHTYAYEWTPEAIVWLIDGVEIRRETGATAQAFAANASAGMQIHLNVWPGDVTFGGVFDAKILPVHQYVDWVQFSAYQAGAFRLDWREDFDGAAVPDGWLVGSWSSPKNNSTHVAQNVSFIAGYAVLSLTADNALGPAGAMPEGAAGGAAGAGAGGSLGTGGAAAAGSGNASGAQAVAGAAPAAGAASTAGAGGAASSAGSPNGSVASEGGCSFGTAKRGDALGAALAFGLLVFVQRRERWRRRRRAF